MNAAHIEIRGDTLVITITRERELRPSASGKTLLVASTRGYYTSSALIEGKPVVVNLTAIISR